MKARILPLVLAGLGAASPVLGQLDPGFATPDVAAVYASGSDPGSYAYNTGWNAATTGAPTTGPAFNSSPATTTPWAFMGQSGIAVAGAVNGFGVPAAFGGAGNQVAFLQFYTGSPVGTIPTAPNYGQFSQGLGALAAGTYTLTFDYLNRTSSGGTLSFNVSILDAGNQPVPGASFNYVGGSTVTTANQSFNLASAGTYSVVFSATSDGGSGDSTAFIDNVSAAVPEPGTWLAGGLATAAAALFVRRRLAGTPRTA